MKKYLALITILIPWVAIAFVIEAERIYHMHFNQEHINNSMPAILMLAGAFGVTVAVAIWDIFSPKGK